VFGQGEERVNEKTRGGKKKAEHKGKFGVSFGTKKKRGDTVYGKKPNIFEVWRILSMRQQKA